MEPDTITTRVGWNRVVQAPIPFGKSCESGMDCRTVQGTGNLAFGVRLVKQTNDQDGSAYRNCSSSITFYEHVLAIVFCTL